MGNKGTLYTSYFAKLQKGIGIKICISRIVPKWLSDKDFDYCFTNLSPSKELLIDYKNNKINWETYTKTYLNELADYVKKLQSRNQLTALRKKLDEGQDVTLYCYEKSSDNCHRHILGDIFKERGYEVKEIN